MPARGMRTEGVLSEQHLHRDVSSARAWNASWRMDRNTLASDCNIMVGVAAGVCETPGNAQLSIVQEEACCKL